MYNYIHQEKVSLFDVDIYIYIYFNTNQHSGWNA